MSASSEQVSGRVRWIQTHDLDNMTYKVLQQEWIITNYERVNDIHTPVSQDKEWRNVPVVDGGLKV